MTKTPFRTDELAISQLPAIILLAKMGWQPLTTAEANNARRNRFGAVILEDITRDFLQHQKLSWGSSAFSLSDANIDDMLRRLKALPPATYGKQAEEKWDLLCLPQSIEQKVDGVNRSINAKFIDFENPENNSYHMVPEFVVEQSKSADTRRPDIVLFVNGIPMAVIENKKAATEVTEGISQTIRNQKPDYIPHLFVYAQVLLSLNKNENRYGTTGTPAKLWNTWRENEISEHTLRALIDTPLNAEVRASIFSDEFAASERFMEHAEEGRLIASQDWALVGLCRPDRLLKLTREFILFDGPNKVIARFQQFDAVRKTLARVNSKEDKHGGVIWHTQGSGKSLTMVMLARALLASPAIPDARIVLVTDRIDLDKQIKGTFKNTGMEPKRATTGRGLAELIRNSNASVITTIINKFETVVRERVRDESADVWALVDEGHRSQYGRYNAQMRRVFPNANFIAFTGTPLAKDDRNTMAEFGPLIDTYTMRDAVEDGAVVPLIYEGRLVKPEMNASQLDTWFDRLTVGKTEAQKADFKKKYARANVLGGLDKIIACRAFDISGHYRANYQGTGLKAQLVVPSKAAAVKYKKELDFIGEVTSEILISAPDTREGHETVEENKPASEVVAFWGEMMTKWGDEEKYNEGLISQFKYSDKPEIIIVVNKLLTGFDAPRNAVLYLTKKFDEPANLLQAIARVNRVLDTDDEGYTTEKEAGYIVDYEGVLDKLDRALSTYDALAGYEEADLQGAIRSIGDVLEELPQRHSQLLDVFTPLSGSADEEAYEVFLADEEVRDEFYVCLTAFSKVLATALGSATFYDYTPEKTINRYKRDLKRFTNLRTAVKRRYAEEIDFRDYEKRIEKVLNEHIGATEIEQVVPPINIFNIETVETTLSELSTDRAKADFISSSMKRTISERMDENPALYQRLSEMLDKIIMDFIEGRYAEVEYFKRVRDAHEDMLSEGASVVPDDLNNDPHAAAFHGYLLTSPLVALEASSELLIEFAKDISLAFKENHVVDLFQRPDNLNLIRGEIDDFIYDILIGENGLELTTAQMDEIQDNIMTIAQRRMVA